MKYLTKIKLTLLLSLVAGGLFAQRTDNRDLRDFTEIRVSEGIEVVAAKGTSNKAEIDASGIDLDRVVTEVRGDQLSIHIEKSWYRRTPRHNVKIRLTYTEELEGIKVNTGAELVFNSVVKARRIDISTSTSGYLEIEVETDNLELGATTSGRIDIEGSAEDIRARASTGGTIYAYDVAAREVSARANTGADIRVRAEDYLTGRAGTGGSISYRGRPKTSVSTNTGGSIRRAN